MDQSQYTRPFPEPHTVASLSRQDARTTAETYRRSLRAASLALAALVFMGLLPLSPESAWAQSTPLGRLIGIALLNGDYGPLYVTRDGRYLAIHRLRRVGSGFVSVRYIADLNTEDPGRVFTEEVLPASAANANGSAMNGAPGADGGAGPCTVGFQDAGVSTPYHAIRWQSGARLDLGTLGAATLSSFATGVSADCGVVVGTSNVTSGFDQHAFRWTAANGMADLGSPAGASRSSRAFGTSSNGGVIVGDADFVDPNDFRGYHTTAFRWTATAGGTFQDLGSLAPAGLSTASAVSGDGAVVVGQNNALAFRWTQAGGLQSLGALAGHSAAVATGVSDNGSVVVGISRPSGRFAYRDSLGWDFQTESRAFRWTAAGGMQDLRQLLVNAGVDMTGITLIAVTGVSPDGQFIAVAATTPTTAPNETAGMLLQYCDASIGGTCAPIGSSSPFSVGATSSALTVAAGASATTNLTVTPRAGFTDPIGFACSGLPRGATCSFAPASVTPAGIPATTALTITTDGGPVAALLHVAPGIALALVPLVIGMGGSGPRRWRKYALRAAIATLLVIASAAGCGGGGGSGSGPDPSASPTPTPTPSPTGTPAGTSTVTVTATSGSGAAVSNSRTQIALTVTR